MPIPYVWSISMLFAIYGHFITNLRLYFLVSSSSPNKVVAFGHSKSSPFQEVVPHKTPDSITQNTNILCQSQLEIEKRCELFPVDISERSDSLVKSKISLLDTKTGVEKQNYVNGSECNLNENKQDTIKKESICLLYTSPSPRDS